ncbi:MAG: TIGR04283 family arsenosugar biosynthesis glycosyltransferase [bacterium]
MNSVQKEQSKSETDVALVIPVYNEEENVVEHLQYHLEEFNWSEVVVVDGGSTDGTVEKVQSFGEGVNLLTTEIASRGRQLRKGVNHTTSSWVVMLHVDTTIPCSFALTRITDRAPTWGWFDCQLDDSSFPYQMISRAISWRSFLLSNPTGDQVLWSHRSLLNEVGGVPDVPIMEDVALVGKLRALQSGQRIKTPVVTSARKWKREGAFRVILLMWMFRCAYTTGVSPSTIYKWYYGRTPPGQSGEINQGG